ncbi:hypothetical protein WG66_001140 [Moniliophthora roreri]|nr:hypothetical protein WG66_001140 [Moniliophthora roreri]
MELKIMKMMLTNPQAFSVHNSPHLHDVPSDRQRSLKFKLDVFAGNWKMGLYEARICAVSTLLSVEQSLLATFCNLLLDVTP